MSVLLPTVSKAASPDAPPVLNGTKFDLEKILPFAMIRQHTKTDDVIGVPDSLLGLYRNAAFEAAEKYTGMLFREQRVVVQDASSTRDITKGNRWKDSFTLRLTYPTIDGVLYLYGGKHTPQVQTLHAEPGATSVKVPINHFAIDMTPCCGDPCGRPANMGRKLMYRAGFSCEQDVPACVIMGALKYIAWMLENPGGEALANVNQANVNPQTSRNNASWQSGAIEEWRLCTDAY